MNDFELLVDKVKTQFPEVEVQIDLPIRPKGGHWAHFKLGQEVTEVEWRPELGFGFFASDAGFGEGPSEIIVETEKAIEKIISNLTLITPRSET